MGMDAEFDQQDLDKLIPRVKKALQNAHDLTAKELWGNLMEFSPQDHGRLAGSWKLQRVGAMESTVGTSVEYALVQNDGSDPYMIYPRGAKALRFEIGGGVIYAKSVRHPGIQGTHYIEGSIAATESRIPEFIEMALAQEGL